jgi:hypothetical protein
MRGSVIDISLQGDEPILHRDSLHCSTLPFHIRVNLYQLIIPNREHKPCLITINVEYSHEHNMDSGLGCLDKALKLSPSPDKLTLLENGRQIL